MKCPGPLQSQRRHLRGHVDLRTSSTGDPKVVYVNVVLFLLMGRKISQGIAVDRQR